MLSKPQAVNAPPTLPAFGEVEPARVLVVDDAFRSPASGPKVHSAIQLAQVAGKGFYSSMGDVHETEKRWSGVGELVLWVAFYFWAVWVFNAFLPPKPEQTPFEAYLKNQIQEQTDGARSGGGQRLDQGSGDQQQHSPQRGDQR